MTDPEIVWCPAERREAVKTECAGLLAAIADVAGNPEIVRALVTPRSRVGDFFDPRGDGVAECRELSRRLGVAVAPADFIVAVARRVPA